MAAGWRLKLGGWLTTSAIVAVVVLGAILQLFMKPIERLRWRRLHPGGSDAPTTVLGRAPQPDGRSVPG